MVLDNTATVLHGLIAAVCPINGVAVGDPNDKTTWRIDFDPSATAPQRSAAQTALDAFDAALAAQAGQLQQVLSAGLSIVSRATPSLNGTYAVDEHTRSDLQGILLYLLAFGMFPGGAATLSYADMSGTPRTLTVAQLKAIAAAITGYAVSVKGVAAMLARGVPATYPPSTVTIA